MGFAPTVRAFLSALMLVALVFAAATGECAACGFSKGARVDSGDCCQPDGSCDIASNMAGCMKSKASNPAVVEQGIQLPQLTVTAGVDLAPMHALHVILPEPVLYSTPPLHLLNAALLI
jgi:hypothetical protein